MDETRTAQAVEMAGVGGIDLGLRPSQDTRVVLYGILRSDINISGAKYHHSQMPDQRLFVEALRMLGDEKSLKDLKDFIEAQSKRNPHMFFEYKKEQDN